MKYSALFARLKNAEFCRPFFRFRLHPGDANADNESKSGYSAAFPMFGERGFFIFFIIGRHHHMAGSAQSVLDTLKPKLRAFVAAYIDCNFNATKAAARIGYKDAKNEGYRLMKREDIQAAIRERTSVSLMTAEEARWHVTEIARADMADFLDIPVPDDKLTPTQKAQRDADSKLARMYPNARNVVRDPLELRLDMIKAEKAGKLHLIKSLKETEFGWEIVLHDKLGALDKILRIHGAYREQVQTAEALDMLRAALIGDLEDDGEEGGVEEE